MFTGKAESGCIFHEVYIRWKIACHVAFVISGLLQLADHAEAAVVENDNDHWDMIGGEGEEFAACHLESAVTGYEKNGFFRFRQLCAHSSRQSESHGAEAAGGDELVGVLDFEMLRGEHLVLSDIGGTEIVFPFEQRIQRLNEEGSRIIPVVFIHRRPGEDLVPPCGNVMRRGASFEHIDDGTHITCDMNAAVYIFMKFSGVDIDMDDGLALAVRCAVTRFSVIETAA